MRFQSANLSSTGLAVALAPSPVYYMTTPSCATTAYVSCEDVANIVLTATSSYADNLNCGVVVYSGHDSVAVVLTLVWFATELNGDFLLVRDGNTTQAPMFASLSGQLTSGGLYVGGTFAPVGACRRVVVLCCVEFPRLFIVPTRLS